MFAPVQASSKHGLIYMVTKFGYVHVFDVETGISIYTVRVSTETIFLTAEYLATNGVIGVNRSGQVMLTLRMIMSNSPSF